MVSKKDTLKNKLIEIERMEEIDRGWERMKEIEREAGRKRKR